MVFSTTSSAKIPKTLIVVNETEQDQYLNNIGKKMSFQGFDQYKCIKYFDICLFPEMSRQEKFKIPVFLESTMASIIPCSPVNVVGKCGTLQESRGIHDTNFSRKSKRINIAFVRRLKVWRYLYAVGTRECICSIIQIHFG